MAKQKISQDEILDGFMEVFRQVGFDGASMEELAKASGLKKSSLYHRFPGGKEQMAKDVLRYSDHWVYINIAVPLQNDGDPIKRLNQALRSINTLYRRGESACILKSLSFENGLKLFGNLIAHSFDHLIKGFTKIGTDFGFSKTEAKKLATDAIVRIQGALIVGRGTGNEKLFPQIIKDIKQSYLNK